ncbi:RidA family protein [Salipiger sp. P9]|uniref:RidA family protein n=1 Tax=Salipiger pentaromativorans TaxID=2943193 RepID=UPI0021577341|nr:RidA family protein [Salipiger pentaromativorans]MCR8547482.1 RidA family protein [Salipiger pentaromativorans]
MQPVRYDKNSRRSRMVEAGGLLFFAGQVADDWDGDIAEQTRQTLARIDALLAEAGSDRSKVLTVQIWIADMADFDAMNAVWDAWIDPENPPGRACGKVEMADPRIKVEMIPVAAK